MAKEKKQQKPKVAEVSKVEPAREPENQLVVFEELKSQIADFVAPTKDVVVRDDKSAAQATEAAKRVIELRKEVELTRRALTDPLRKKADEIKAYADNLAEPLASAEAHLRRELNTWAQKQWEAEQAELRRIAEDKRRAEAEIARKRKEDEDRLMAEQEAEAEAIAEANRAFGTGEKHIDEVNAETDQRLTNEWKEKQAQLAEVEANVYNDFAKREHDARSLGIKNTRVKYRMEVVNLSVVPDHFTIKTVNEKMAQAAFEAALDAGQTLDIPGLRFIPEAKVAIGAKTYVPSIRGARGQP